MLLTRLGYGPAMPWSLETDWLYCIIHMQSMANSRSVRPGCSVLGARRAHRMRNVWLRRATSWQPVTLASYMGTCRPSKDIDAILLDHRS